MNPHFTKRGIRPSGPVRQASSRQQRFVDGPFWFKLLVPDTVVGMIMGMRGSTIMRLEKENSAVVRFSPYSHYFPGTDKRIIIGAKNAGSISECAVGLSELVYNNCN
mmetsp:Transcript_11557/g.9839  ORF Transcript_11557/g.9839 Transcript_11557/m.9839 type:complete len:107 (+) Transcript_11557:46-366(+)